MLARPFVQLAAVFTALTPALASAAGFEYPDLGAAALGRAGAFTAAADDPTAIAYNPAGLADLQGVNLLTDGALSNDAVTFRRREAPYTRCITDPLTGEERCSQAKPDADGRYPDTVSFKGTENDGAVSNQAGWFFGPFAAASYGLQLSGDRALGFGIAAYGPPGIGRYQYPRPNYEDANYDAAKRQYIEDPRRTAPQRYSLIESNILIAYPSAAVAFRPNRWLSAGITVQYVYYTAQLSRAITDSLPEMFDDAEHPGCNPEVPDSCGPTRMRDENPAADSQISLDASGHSWTGVLGVLARPHPRLSIGASLRPGYWFKAEGQMKLTLSRLAQEVGAEIVGDRTRLEFRMPTTARLGARVDLGKGIDVELDGTYEGWHSVDNLRITPMGVSVVALGREREIAPISIEKNWRDTWSVRLGAEALVPWRLPLGLSARLRAGVLYETSAIPLEYTEIDFPNWERIGETVGLSVGTSAVQLVFAGALLQQPQREVTNSKIYGLPSDENLSHFPVGNGTYTSNYTLVNIGLRGRL